MLVLIYLRQHVSNSNGHLKTIKNKKVYYTTALFSVGHPNFTHCKIHVTMPLPLAKQLRKWLKFCQCVNQQLQIGSNTRITHGLLRHLFSEITFAICLLSLVWNKSYLDSWFLLWKHNPQSLVKRVLRLV